MKRLLVASLALALSACAGMTAPVLTPSSTPPTSGIITKAGTVILTGERAFAAAEVEWQSAIAIGQKLVARGVIKGDTATTVRGWNATARDLIVKGKAAADGAEKARAAAGLFGLVDKLSALSGGK